MNLVVCLSGACFELPHQTVSRMAGSDLDFTVYPPVYWLQAHAAYKIATLRVTCPSSTHLPDSIQLNSVQLNSAQLSSTQAQCVQEILGQLCDSNE